MKRPLIWVAICYAGGLLLGKYWQQPLTVLFCIGFVLVLGAILLGRLRILLVWPLILLVGWVNFVTHISALSGADLRLILTDEPEDVTIRGLLVETPSARMKIQKGKETWRTLAKVEVFEICRKTKWQSAHGEIVVTTKGEAPTNLFAGQIVEIPGIIEHPPDLLAEGLFDYRNYLAGQNIYFQLKANPSADWHALTPGQPSFSDRFLDWAQNTMARGLPIVDEPLELLWDMTLGRRTGIVDEEFQPFMQSGTMHIFAISGLHIALISWIFVSLLRVARMRRVWCGAIIIPLIWFYTAATGWQPSAVRSTIMMTIIIGGWSLKRPSNLLNSLAAAGLVILLYDPRQLFQASFQLSFFVVLSIALIMPPLEKVRDRFLQIDPLLPGELVPRWKRWRNRGLRILLTSLATSLAAWLGSWPLVAYYFHIFSPITLLANLLIVPASSLALMCNLGSLMCGSWLPAVTELFNHSAWFWMWCIMKISEFAVRIPHAFFYVVAPAAADFVIYYAVLPAFLSGIAFRRKWRWITVGAVVCILGFYGWRWNVARHTTTLSILPLEGGSAIFVRTGGDKLLIDCGDSNAVEMITIPFLHAQGVNHVPALALTQGDLNDVGGALELCEAFSVDRVFTSGIQFRSKVYRMIVDTIGHNPGRHVAVNRGDWFGQWQVLHPAATNRFSRADDGSLVLSATIQKVPVLLLSDLGRPGQNFLLAGTNDLRADILVTGLPEGSEPVCDALLDAVRPKVLVVMDSKYPAPDRASPVLRERLAARQIPVYYTSESGGVRIVVHAGKWEILLTTSDKAAWEISEK